MATKTPRSLPIRFAGGLLMAIGAFIYVGKMAGLPVDAVFDLTGTFLIGGAVIYSVGEVIRTWD